MSPVRGVHTASLDLDSGLSYTSTFDYHHFASKTKFADHTTVIILISKGDKVHKQTTVVDRIQGYV